MAVRVSTTRLTIALIRSAVNLAAILTTVRRKLVGGLSSEQIVAGRQAIEFLENTVIDLRCDSSRAEGVLDKCVAG